MEEEDLRKVGSGARLKYSIDIETDVFKKVLEKYHMHHKVKAIMEEHSDHIKVYFDIPKWYPGNVHDIHATAFMRLGFYLGQGDN